MGPAPASRLDLSVNAMLPLAREGYFLLAERLRSPAERTAVREALERHLRVTLPPPGRLYGAHVGGWSAEDGAEQTALEGRRANEGAGKREGEAREEEGFVGEKGAPIRMHPAVDRIFVQSSHVSTPPPATPPPRPIFKPIASSSWVPVGSLLVMKSGQLPDIDEFLLAHFPALRWLLPGPAAAAAHAAAAACRQPASAADTASDSVDMMVCAREGECVGNSGWVGRKQRGGREANGGSGGFRRRCANEADIPSPSFYSPTSFTSTVLFHFPFLPLW